MDHVLITYTGADGSAWDLTTGGQGVRVGPGVRGLHTPMFSAHWTEQLGDGDRYRGSRVPRREIFLPLQVDAEYQDGQAWRQLDARVWRAFRRDTSGTLAVTADGATRTIGVRQAPAAEHTFDRDPGPRRFEQYGLLLNADLPYYAGAEISQVWQPDLGVNFYGGGPGLATLGPPYVISGTGTLGAATIINPGDAASPAKWIFTGAMTSAAVSVAGHPIAVPFAIAAAAKVTITTDPPAVYDDQGLSLWTQMTGPADLAPIPSGTSSVSATLTGGGSGSQIELRFTPRYERGW